MRSEMLSIELCGRTFSFHRPADLETLWERMSEQNSATDERIPYWVELWPSAIVLAKWLLRRERDIAGRRCLDLGCGLGLCTQAAASCRAKVVGTDYEAEALHFASRSCTGVQPWSWMGMDWRKPCFQSQAFPFIFGADILYETRFFAPLLDLWAELLAPGGRIWIATPDRHVSRPFWEQTLPRAGWRACCLLQEEVTFQSYTNMRVSLWEISSRSQCQSQPA